MNERVVCRLELRLQIVDVPSEGTRGGGELSETGRLLRGEAGSHVGPTAYGSTASGFSGVVSFGAQASMAMSFDMSGHEGPTYRACGQGEPPPMPGLTKQHAFGEHLNVLA